MTVALSDFFHFRTNGNLSPVSDSRIGRPRAVDFRALLGRPQWFALPEAVRWRFDAESHEETRLYPGTMQVRASLAGRLIAQLCRLIGTPLAPFTGEEVPVQVRVYGDHSGAMVWDRTYHFARRAPVMVTSRKIADSSGRLMEVVRGGLGMTLEVTVEDHALHFRSTGYFLELADLRLPIPGLITPGRAHVVHQDLGEHRFRFTLEFHHPWLGETFFQTGVFRDPLERRAS